MNQKREKKTQQQQLTTSSTSTASRPKTVVIAEVTSGQSKPDAASQKTSILPAESKGTLGSSDAAGRRNHRESNDYFNKKEDEKEGTKFMMLD